MVCGVTDRSQKPNSAACIVSFGLAGSDMSTTNRYIDLSAMVPAHHLFHFIYLGHKLINGTPIEAAVNEKF